MSAMMDIVHPRERLAAEPGGRAAGARPGDRQLLLRTHGRLALDHLGLGELAAADARIDAFEALARELPAPWLLWRAPLLRSMRARMHGRFAEAERLIAAGAEQLGREVRDPQVERCVALHRRAVAGGRAARRDAGPGSGRPPGEGGAGGRLSWQAVGSALVAWRVEDAAQARLHIWICIGPETGLPADNLFGLFHRRSGGAGRSRRQAEQLLGLIERAAASRT